MLQRSGAVTMSVLLALLCAILVGCGESNVAEPEPEPVSEPGSGGELGWTVASVPRSLDPLTARSYPDEMIAAQIFEPLFSEVRGPQTTGAGRVPGLAAVSPSRGERTWTIQLRPGVRFQDGTSLDADAVVANFDRWLLMRSGRRLLPAVRDVTAQSDLTVRVRLTRPEAQFRETLASRRLAVISPEAFSTTSPQAARVLFPELAGTGPFRLGDRDSRNLTLDANVTWWATALSAGPALNQVVFTYLGTSEERLAAVEAGDFHVADGPFPEGLGDNPLLVLRELVNGQTLAVERSVRGLSTSQYPPMLSRTWLTDLGS